MPPGPAGGRQWERWVAHDLLPGGAVVRQGPGTLRLFGMRSASGMRHELDGAAGWWWGSVLLEAKAYQGVGPSKDDICVFQQKSFDFCLARLRAGTTTPHWRVIASAGPISDAVQRYCYLHGIVAIDPALLPLPLLLRYAARPAADCFASPSLWAELVRLAERAVVPFEGRHVPIGRTLAFDVDWWPESDLDDLLYLQREVTEAIYERVDEEDPEFYAQRAVSVLAGVGGAAPRVGVA